jgi:hypothetical protein
MPRVSGTALRYCTEPMRNFGVSADMREDFNAKTQGRQVAERRMEISRLLGREIRDFGDGNL